MQQPIQVLPVTEQRVPTAATTIATIDLKLQSLLSDLTRANDYDSVQTIVVLERMGLSTATSFVKPLLEILKRSPESPLRSLSTFQMQALYVPNERSQRIVLDELEADLIKGSREISSVRTGIVRILQLQYKAKVDVAKQREGRAVNRTRDDYAREVVELRDKVDVYEQALERAASEVDMDVNTFVASLLLQDSSN